MSRIAIVIPTITGREYYYDICKNSYLSNTEGHDVDLFTSMDFPTLGISWQEGVDQVDLDDFDYLHLTCDDAEVFDGWADAAIECVEEGFVPAPMAHDIEGNVISYGHPPDGMMYDWKPTQTTVSPFCKSSWWEKIGPMIPLHYWTDDWFSYKARINGWETRCRTGYKTRHHHAMIGRGAGMDESTRLRYDMELYYRVVGGGLWPSKEEAIGC